MEKNNNTINWRSKDEWLKLADKYFEAETSEEEELSLKLFLSSPEAEDEAFNEIKAVMGYTSVGKRLEKAKPKSGLLSHIGTSGIAAAILLCCVLSVSLIMIGKGNRNQCLVYIDGELYTDTETVLSQMQFSIDLVKSETDDMRMENQIKNLFDSADEYKLYDNKEQ